MGGNLEMGPFPSKNMRSEKTSMPHYRKVYIFGLLNANITALDDGENDRMCNSLKKL
jgi:hypothetical protein